MPDLANGARTRMLYIAEVTQGVTPGTPTMKELRCLGRDINLKKSTLTTEEMRQDREITDVRHGYKRVEANLPFELGYSYMDDMLEAALSGTWAAPSQVTDVAVVTGKFNRATGSWITDGFRPGNYILTAGFTNSANNGTFRIVSLTATDITVAETLVNETTDPAQTVDLKGKQVSIGTTLRTFTFERQMLDTPLYDPFLGCAINTMNLDIRPEQLIKGALGIVGINASAEAGSSIASGVTAAPTNSPFSAFQGLVYEGGTQIAVVTQIAINLANGRGGVPVVGSAITPAIFEGRAVVTGQMTAFFSNSDLFNKFVNETESALEVKLVDPTDATKFLNIVMPRIKYTGGDKNPPREGPIPLVMPFQALRDATYGTTMWMQRTTV